MCSYTKLKEAVEQRLPMPTAVQVTGIGTYPQDDELMYCLFVCHKALGKYIFTAETFEGTYLITHSRKVCVCVPLFTAHMPPSSSTNRIQICGKHLVCISPQQSTCPIM